MKHKILFLIIIAIFIAIPLYFVLAKVDTSLPVPTGGKTINEAGGGVVGYIYVFFQFGLAMIGIVAFGSIIYGAVKYMAAAGDPSGITEAKGRIFSALWGIGIALTSIIFLGTINPDLVNFFAAGEFSSIETLPVLIKCGDPSKDKTTTLSGACSDKKKNCYLVPAKKDGKDVGSFMCLTEESYRQMMAQYLYNLGKSE